MTVDTDSERLIRGYEGRLFLWISIGWAVVGLGRKLLPPLLPAIISNLGITAFQAGAALTTLWLVRAINQYPGGRLSDELSRKTVLVTSVLILAFGFVLLSVSHWYLFFVFALAVIGFGDGAYSVVLRSTVADLYVEKRGRAFGIQGAFNGLAGMGAAGGAILVLAVGTWRSAFFPIGVYLAITAVGLHLWQRESYVLKKPDLEISETVLRLLDNRTVRHVVGAYVFFMFAWQGMIGFLPVFLQAEKGLSTTLASLAFGSVYLVGVGAAPLAGFLGDNVGKLRTVLAVLICALSGLAALLVADSVASIAVSILVLSIGFRSFFDLAQAFLMDTFRNDTMSGDLGAVKTIWSGLGSLGPMYVGWMAGVMNYSVAYFGLAVCVLLSFVLVTLLSFRGEI